jgi:hypothetical protein
MGSLAQIKVLVLFFTMDLGPWTPEQLGIEPDAPPKKFKTPTRPAKVQKVSRTDRCGARG